jgi:zinc transport system substrate-binding protein
MIAILLLTGCARVSPAGPTASPSQRRLSVVVSIPPLADFARQVGDNRVDVITLVPPGASPHTYTITPAQAVALSKADVFIFNDIGLEFWAKKTIAASGNSRLVVINASEGIPVLAGDQDGSGGNPHVWLDPQLAIRQVERIRDGLIIADPAGRATYKTAAAAYIAELRALDVEIAQEVQTWRRKQFVAFHPSFAYFARRYGLVQAAVVEPTAGKEPSPAELLAIISTLRRIHARAIFAEPQLSAKAAETIARETGIQVLTLDPLGATISTGRYVDLMQYNVSQLSKALK